MRAAIELFEEQELALDWLSSPLPILGGESPLHYSLKNEQEVLDLIGRLRHGEFS